MLSNNYTFQKELFCAYALQAQKSSYTPLVVELDEDEYNFREPIDDDGDF